MGCSTGLYHFIRYMHLSFKMFEHVHTQGFEPRMSLSKSVPHMHWLPMFLHLFNTVFEKLHVQWHLHFAIVVYIVC